jgi:hypothetical protein
MVGDMSRIGKAGEQGDRLRYGDQSLDQPPAGGDRLAIAELLFRRESS